MESQDNQDLNNMRGVCCSIMRYLISAVERRVADSQGIATNLTAPSSNVQSQFARNEGQDNTPVVSNVSRSSCGEKLHQQKPKFIDMPMAENEAEEQKMEEIFELGYDSDGELPFFGDVQWEKSLLEAYNESPLQNEGEEQPALQEQPTNLVAEEAGGGVVMIADNAIMKLKVAELQKELHLRALSMRGLKAELQSRLKKAMEDKVPIGSAKTSEAVAQTRAFLPGAHWSLLTPTNDAVPDPTANSGFREPTNSDKIEGIKHHNFAESFDRPVFASDVKEVALDRFKRRKRDENNNFVWETKK